MVACLGASLVPSSLYPESFWFLLDALPDGRNRKKEPRLWQRVHGSWPSEGYDDLTGNTLLLCFQRVLDRLLQAHGPVLGPGGSERLASGIRACEWGRVARWRHFWKMLRGQYRQYRAILHHPSNRSKADGGSFQVVMVIRGDDDLG